jgi:cell division protein FtsB
MTLSANEVASFLCDAVAGIGANRSFNNNSSNASESIVMSSTDDCNVTVSSFLFSDPFNAAASSAAVITQRADLGAALTLWGTTLTEAAARSAVLSSTVATSVVLIAALWFAFRFLLPSTATAGGSESLAAAADHQQRQLANVMARLEEVEDLLTQQQQVMTQQRTEVATLRRQVAQLSEDVQLVEEERKELQVQLNYRRSGGSGGGGDASLPSASAVTSASPVRQNSSPHRRSQVIEKGVATTTPLRAASSRGGSTSEVVQSLSSTHRTFVVSSSPHRR